LLYWTEMFSMSGLKQQHNKTLYIYISPTMKNVGGRDSVSCTGPYKVPYALSMGTITGKTHIKTISSLSRIFGRHFIDSALCSCEGSVT
jgi:hypothetical protein